MTKFIFCQPCKFNLKIPDFLSIIIVEWFKFNSQISFSYIFVIYERLFIMQIQLYQTTYFLRLYVSCEPI